MSSNTSTTDVKPACDTDALNSLLRGELSAVETYEQGIAKFDDSAHKSTLMRIRDEHVKAATKLQGLVRSYGGEPSTGSGPWGTFVTALTGTAKVIGPQALLSVLKQGEEHGISHYEKALDNEGLPIECKYTLRAESLPSCRQHVAMLDGLILTLENSPK